ncbi:UNVERIFIED_CONTAM: hypothetical protein GTU68_019570 [Idotea baltica]|nr:hypothetical protein [Idotea baltica]
MARRLKKIQPTFQIGFHTLCFDLQPWITNTAGKGSMPAPTALRPSKIGPTLNITSIYTLANGRSRVLNVRTKRRRWRTLKSMSLLTRERSLLSVHSVTICQTRMATSNGMC